MSKFKTKVKTRTDYELRLATGYKIAVIVIMSSGVLAFTVFSMVWKIKT
ncbi:MAG: hypothetical protein WCT08_02410 [Patescibacteria group bacterium]|jgi:hypothetical protein